MFRMNKIKVLASLPLSKQRLSPPQLFLIIFLILQIFVGSLFSTLLNLVVVSYTSLGVPSTIQSTFVEGLGPLSYLSSGSLARIKNATNSITYGNLAHLFTKSSLMVRFLIDYLRFRIEDISVRIVDAQLISQLIQSVLQL